MALFLEITVLTVDTYNHAYSVSLDAIMMITYRNIFIIISYIFLFYVMKIYKQTDN